MGVFKAYDIRGLSPSEIDEPLARRVGFAFASLLRKGGKRGALVLGRDIRPDSGALSRELAEGARDAGLDVIDIGLATTPMVYFAVHTLNALGGVMVTASHNPAGYNGFKLCREQAIPVGSTSGLKDVEAAVAELKTVPVGVPRGELRSHDVIPAFRTFLHERGKGLPRLKVAIDTANGVVGPFVKKLLDGLPLEIVPLFFEPDGRFPNHEANPLKLENLRDLQKAVLKHGCALGIAFDGDGDRAAFVDEKGTPVAGDMATALIARTVLAEAKGPILYDLRSSRAVREEVERLGGTAHETRVGHAFIKEQMRAQGALFAGELSGHYYFRENACAEEAFIAAFRIMALMGTTRKPLSALVAEVDRYPRTGELNFHVEDKDGAIARVTAAFPGAEVAKLDGVTLRLPTWWLNLRKSNTEPLLRLNLEAGDAASLAQRKAEVIAAIGIEPEA